MLQDDLAHDVDRRIDDAELLQRTGAAAVPPVLVYARQQNLRVTALGVDRAVAETVAAGGIVRIVNGCQVKDGRVVAIELPDNPLPIFQVVEYLRAFLTGRVGWSGAECGQ